MGTPLTREKALGGVRAQNGAPRIPSQLELIAQQAMGLQSQINALVGSVMLLLAQQAPEEPSGPVMPATFGGSTGGGSLHEEEGP